MAPFFSVDDKVVANCNQHKAVEVFRQLLCAEAHRLGIPPISINVPTAVNVADGGIDASVETSMPLPREGLISCHCSRFQIKAGRSFKPWRESAITNELFGSKPPGKKSSLGDAVKKCLDDNGRYVLVCFGNDVVGKNLDNAKKYLNKHFRACGYRNPQFDVLGTSKLVSQLEVFPALVVELSRDIRRGLYNHASWSNDLEMSHRYISNINQQKIIEDLQAGLRVVTTRQTRVLGDAGIGKTRLVLEATRADDLRGLVLYCNASDSFLRDLIAALAIEPRYAAILVVDECDPDTSVYLADKLGKHAERIKVVTIYQTRESTSGLALLDAPSLDELALIGIMRAYEVIETDARRWVQYCGGSPRVAHVIAGNIRDGNIDVLQPTSTNQVWEAFIRGPLGTSEQDRRHRRVILRHIALFQRFGFVSPVVQEAKSIAALVSDADVDITWPRFCEIVEQLRRGKILQGQRTLYISPQALQIWLWSEWWDNYGTSFEFEDFVGKLSGNLRQWFFDMIRYAHRSTAATRVVETLLGPDGPFADGTLLRTELGSDFFLALTDASPEGAISCLERTVGAWSHDELVRFTTGRNGVRFALERIVVWQPLFVRGARVLLALAAAENERWANNSTGVFSELFSTGYGRVATTEASPEERFPVLEEALLSPVAERRTVGLKAADEALNTGSVTRMVGAEYQGLKPPPELWSPKTYGELFDALRRVWRLLDRLATTDTREDRVEIAAVLVKRSRGLLGVANLAAECLTTLRRLVAVGVANSRTVIDVCEDVLHYDNGRIAPDTLEGVKALRDELVGTGFAGMLHRYVGMSRLEDRYDDGERSDKLERIIKELADRAAADRSLLSSELAWLVSKEAENAYSFGYELAKRDPNRELQPQIEQATCAALETNSLTFLSGYMKHVFESDVSKWEAELDRLADDAMAPFVPELTWRSGMTDDAARRIIRLVRSRRANPSVLGMFRFGRTIDRLPEHTFGDLIETLMLSDWPSASALAVDLTSLYVEDKEHEHKINADLIQRVLTQPSLFEAVADGDRTMLGYHWTGLAKNLVAMNPDAGPHLLGLIIDNSHNVRGFLRRYDRDTIEIAQRILDARPTSAWNSVLQRLNSAEEDVVSSTVDWLGGGFHDDAKGLWDVIPLDELWTWIEENVDERAWHIATVVPKSLESSDDGIVTRELLIRYGDRKDVQSNLLAHFTTGSWWGNASDHYAELRERAMRWRETESEPRIANWLDLYIRSLDHRIEKFRIDEERE